VKDIDELNFPDNLRYSEEHLWVKVDGDNAKIGITDYAQDRLEEIVFVELPQIDDVFEMNKEFGAIESVKVAVELYMPVGAQILAVNNVLDDAPGIISVHPYDEGWMLEVKIKEPSELESLLSKEGYIAMLKESAEQI
jgi:glycine cleavage system H protein